MLYKQCRFPPFNETLNGPRNQNTERENEAYSSLTHVKVYGSSILCVYVCHQKHPSNRSLQKRQIVRVPTLGKGAKKWFRLLDELADFDSPSNVL